jgi:hypothetical protein
MTHNSFVPMCNGKNSYCKDMRVMFTKYEHIPARREVGESSSLSVVDRDHYRTTESEVVFGNIPAHKK